MAVTYCTADDVRRILQNDFSFGTTTTPTQADIEANINAAEDFIDRETGHAWRTKVVAEEYYDMPTLRFNSKFGNQLFQSGIPVFLKHRQVRELDTEEGDKLEIWDGSSYVDWTTTKTQGRANDFWIAKSKGKLYLRYFYPYYREEAIRITYRFGETSVPYDIRDATAKKVAIDYILNDDRSNMLNETGDPTRMNYDERVNRMNAEINRCIRNHLEIKTIR